KKLNGIFWKACKAYTTKDFDKAISKLRGHRPEVVRKLKEAGFEKWSRAYFPRSRYSYMTSNSVESINSLTRIVRRILITMLVEYCRDLLQMWEEHLSEEARLDEERLGNEWVYMDWDDVQASKEPVTTTEGMAVENWQAVQGRLDLYNPCINFLSHVENDNYYQSQLECSIQSNNQQSQPESCINYHFFHLDDM
nr:transposase, MuDR, MULE transposase domain protein [Tanacetum cinerariifolium]